MSSRLSDWLARTLYGFIFDNIRLHVMIIPRVGEDSDFRRFSIGGGIDADAGIVDPHRIDLPHG